MDFAHAVRAIRRALELGRLASSCCLRPSRHEEGGRDRQWRTTPCRTWTPKPSTNWLRKARTDANGPSVVCYVDPHHPITLDVNFTERKSIYQRSIGWTQHYKYVI